MLAVLMALALPAAAQAHTPSLSVAQAGAAIHAADHHLTIQSCTRWSRVTIRCDYAEDAIYLGIETEGPAVWESWALVRQTRHGITVIGPTI